MTGDRPTASSVGGLEVRRSLRIDALIDKPPEDSAGAMAVVYAELDTPTPPAGLDDPAAIQQHLCIVRSLVELR
jgi:hypothetical protein